MSYPLVWIYGVLVGIYIKHTMEVYMNNKEHKKISRQRKRLDRVCSDLQFGGGVLIILGLFSDMMRAICAMQFQPGIGSDQWIIIGFGALMVFLGWRGRR